MDRLDLSQMLENASDIQHVLEQGRSIMIFPEGTFTEAAGLKDFKLGAFKLAVDTQTPLCPLGLRAHANCCRIIIYY